MAFIVIILLPSMLTGHAPWQQPTTPPLEKIIPSRAPDSGPLSIIKVSMHNILLFASVVLLLKCLKFPVSIFTGH